MSLKKPQKIRIYVNHIKSDFYEVILEVTGMGYFVLYTGNFNNATKFVDRIEIEDSHNMAVFERVKK